ncbi:MAG: glycosyltransferase [Cryobacterium sp.]|nr:glycosyltransferase [Cryobacterium sp.]
MEISKDVVSIVIVNFRGADDTLEAIRRLGDLDWPRDRIEIVVVENGSGDDSAARIADLAPHVNLVVSKENLGFAGGCNLGVRHSRGEFVGFLNNDAKPDAQWVSAAMEAFATSPRVGAVASRVLDWDGRHVDYIGSAMTWFGMGYKPFTGEKVPRHAGTDRADVLFGTGSAMFVRRSVFDSLDGFDERYFMFFEDVDFGWRMALRGLRFLYEPASIAFHKHHASMTSFGSHKEAYLLERNALFTLYKNLGDEALNQALPAAMALAARRGITMGGLDSGEFDLRRGGSDDSEMQIPRISTVPLYALDQFVEELPALKADRDRIQSQRVVSDSTVWKLFGLADAPVIQDDDFVRGYENIVTAFEVTERPPATRVLIITGDPIGLKLAGPAIRAWSMAEALARSHDVTLVSLTSVRPVDAPFAVVHVRPGDERAMAPLERWADVIIFQGHAMAVFDTIRRSTKIIVADVYDPMHLEQLEQGRELGSEVWAKQVADATVVINEQLERGDFFLCASERQRHLYLGQLAGLGRITPVTYDGDPDLRRLIDVVPFGFATDPPRHERDVLKGVLPGIEPDHKLLIWSGGLYNWFDPITLIEAMSQLSQRRSGVHLYFQGTKHPHPGVPEMEIVTRSRETARRLGLLDSVVHFNDSWVDYADRQNYLTEADAGVSTHFAHIETTFSFRTRILDYLWAGLPMVLTRGDHFAELVETERLGVVVDATDVDELTDALEKILFDHEFIAEVRENIARVREQYLWDRVLQPLVDFVSSASPAADRLVQEQSGGADQRRQRKKRSGFRHDLQLAYYHLKNGGPRVVLGKVRRRLSR